LNGVGGEIMLCPGCSENFDRLAMMKRRRGNRINFVNSLTHNNKIK